MMRKRWKPEEEQYLLDNWGKMPSENLAEHFGRTPADLCDKYNKLIRRASSEEKQETRITPEAEAKAHGMSYGMYMAMLYEQEQDRKSGKRKCPVCGRRFLPKGGEHRYCSPDCHHKERLVTRR